MPATSPRIIVKAMILCLKELQIKMSLQLFHKVPTGAIKRRFDEQNQPLFKRADLGKYVDIENIKLNFKDFPSHYTRLRSGLKGGRFDPLPWEDKKSS